MARISKGDFGKRHCNTEMSTVIPINLKSGRSSENKQFFNSNILSNPVKNHIW